jgi:hypothetical protein
VLTAGLTVLTDSIPSGLARLYADIGRRLGAFATADDALTAITRAAVAVVPGADVASISRLRNNRFTTAGATDPAAAGADDLQYELGAGPCLDAIRTSTVVCTTDLASDPRWSGFGPRAAEAVGLRSSLSLRLFLQDGRPDGLRAGLNLYSRRPGAFDDEALVPTTVVAAHGALAVTAALARERTAQLEHAVATNREVGVAMGVVMLRRGVTREEAFDLLRFASQTSNRKLHTIASEVADTGDLDLPPTSPAAAAGRAG